VHQPSRDVAAVGAIHLDDRIVAFVELEQAPFGRPRVQVRHALAHQRRGTRGNKENEPLNKELPCRRFPAHIEPQNSEGQSGIDRTLHLRSIHAQHRKGCLTVPQ